MNPKDIMLSEISQTQRQIRMSLMCRTLKKKKVKLKITEIRKVVIRVWKVEGKGRY